VFVLNMEPMTRLELVTSSLPRRCSTAELHGHVCECENGAGNGIRTRDPQLGRLMLYQLSYSRLKTKEVVGAGGLEPP
jgi:hypothetical protein